MRYASLIVILTLSPSLPAIDTETSFRGFAMLEQGPVTFAALSGLGADFALLVPTQSGEIALQVGVFSGSFIGESLGLRGAIAYRLLATEDWRPSLGLAYQLDCGSRLISSFALDGIPETPMSYLGLQLELIAFQAGNFRWSLLGTTVSLALCEGPPIIQAEIDLLRLGQRSNTDAMGIPAPPEKLWLSLSYGLNYSLLGFGLGGFRPLTAEASIRLGSLELAGTYMVISDNPRHYLQSWAYSISILLAPHFGAWHPAIGFGYFEANPDYLIGDQTMSLVKKGDFNSWIVSIKLLRFEIPLKEGLALLLSLGDLHFGSIFPSSLQNIGNSGPLAIVADIFRIGVSFQP